MATDPIIEGRDAIQDLPSEPIAEGNLAELLTAMSQELANSRNENGQSPAFDLIEEGERLTLSPITRNEVCRLALEILRNAYQHSHAQRIEIEIRYADDVLRVRIRDDGKGMDPKVPDDTRSGHGGFRGIRERAQQIGAQLDVWSKAGTGIEVELAVPGAVAYESFRDSYRDKFVRKMKSHGQRS